MDAKRKSAVSLQQSFVIFHTQAANRMAVMTKLIQALWRLPGEALIAAARIYQATVGPLLGPRCRFEPTCSAYFILAVRKYGAVRGTLRGIARICRCHPWHPGGYDPP
jgi:uncharacterized protein